MQIQTVFKAGNSDVVAIPKYISSELGIKTGNKVLVKVIEDGVLIQKVSKKKIKETAATTREFKKWLEGALKEDAEILDELANR